MAITVAMRIIGGFAIISILFVILGASSIQSVIGIGNASKQMSQVAIPTVNSSAELNATFMNMSRLIFEAFLSSTNKEIKQHQASYNDAKSNFELHLSTLKKAVNSDVGLTASVDELENIYKQYNSSASSMFSFHKMNIQLNSDIERLIDELESVMDDSASLLIDFSDSYKDASVQKENTVTVQASAVEVSLSMLLTAATDFSTTQTLSRAKLRESDVNTALAQIQSRFSILKDYLDQTNTPSEIVEVQTLLDSIGQTILSDKGLVKIKLNQLGAEETASGFLHISDQHLDQAHVQLAELAKLVDTQSADVTASVSQQIISSIWLIGASIVVSLSVAIAVTYFTVKAIIRPLAKINEFLHFVSAGDLTHSLNDSAKDEFGTLAQNCNSLVISLKELIHSINGRAQQLTSASSETSNVTRHATISIDDQKSQLAQIAAATQQMHVTAKHVSANAEDTLKEIKIADMKAENVKTIATDNKLTIETLAINVDEASRVITKLHEESSKIGGILDVIKGIAEQTNLLALNAAIEAARAGEQGRGFSVVADEVRTLASRTQKSTQEINAMIEGLQSGAEQAVTVMKKGKEQTVTCVKQSEDADAALVTISDAVHAAVEVSNRIEQAAQEQLTVSSDISERLENIVMIAEETAQGAKQTSESSDHFATLAEALQTSINRFKV